MENVRFTTYEVSSIWTKMHVRLFRFWAMTKHYARTFLGRTKRVIRRAFRQRSAKPECTCMVVKFDKSL